VAAGLTARFDDGLEMVKLRLTRPASFARTGHTPSDVDWQLLPRLSGALEEIRRYIFWRV